MLCEKIGEIVVTNNKKHGINFFTVLITCIQTEWISIEFGKYILFIYLIGKRHTNIAINSYVIFINIIDKKLILIIIKIIN